MEFIRALIDELIEEMEWEPEEVTDEQAVVRINGEHGYWLWRCVWPEDGQVLLSYSICPFDVPEEKRAIVSEYLVRANYGLYVGNFEMDMRDGEVRYKTSMPMQTVEMNLEILRDIIFVNFATFDRYVPGLMAVVYGDVMPETAINNIEAKPETEEDANESRSRILGDLDWPNDN